MTRTYVALDLETTGLDAERDAIIEIGAVKFQGTKTLGTFSTLINPGRTIPLPVTELTGIQDKDLAHAPRLQAVLPRLMRFVGRHPIVGHSVEFDLRFLQRYARRLDVSPPSTASTKANDRACEAFGNEYLDTFELSTILLSHAERYSLESLAKSLGIELKHAHRALDDAQASRLLFQILLREAAKLPPRLLQEIIRHSERSRWAAAGFFRDALALADGRPPAAPPTVPRPQVERPLQPVAQRTPLESGRLAALLEEGGAFAQHFPHYECRPQQVTMLRAIAEALNQGHHLMVEAPTGVGKSLAYLIPAVYWATQNNERVIISTNTVNLQEQLYHKDLPELALALPLDFRATVLKGRSHYLCPARLQTVRRRGARSPDEARLLAKILVWLQRTPNGDGDTLFIPDPVERTLWRQLSAENESCTPERCTYYKNGRCYFYNARRAAESAHLVIINHALLLADVAVQNRALPEYRFLIVDEAHHLESATTDGLGFETDPVSIRRLLLGIGRLSDSGQVSGLLAETIGRCQKAGLPEELMSEIELLVGQAGMAVTEALRSLTHFFNCLETFVVEERQNHVGPYTFRLRITSGIRVQPAWESVEIAWDQADTDLATVLRLLERMTERMEDLVSLVPYVEDIQSQVRTLAFQLDATRTRIDRMIFQPDPSDIYWIEMDNRRDRMTLHIAPLHVGPMVEQHLFHQKESVILTSATLRTEGTFDFLRERLNAWEADELAVGSPFDYANAALVYLVDDIPEVGHPGYQRAVEQGMLALFLATQGRALALFTSYSQLRATQRAIQAPLAQAGITVQAQGEGISRGQLLENFRSGEKRVLLGTRSFWEGVDVPGEALSCLAIARLPFSVPSDPVFAARAETFDQPFLEYAVPEAILRFRQGFGRLIRTRNDRGVVAVFDKRLLSKNYGAMFIASLPEPTIRRGPLEMLPQHAVEWLNR